ncbi:MAG: PTS sugar transporter subunit IIA [Candidatus Hydrogenedentes bacterium]|nr:PTS sugar transporter subunit IIA [Candidatus Hydrogenedentota bacterium]
MLLSEMLRPDLIKVGLEAENKKEAIGELVDLLVQQHEISMAQRPGILEAILENDAKSGAGMEKGVAIPHGLSDRVDDILCALGTAKKGVPFDSLDGNPANVVVLFIVPKRNTALEVRTLSGLHGLLTRPGFTEKLVTAADAEALYRIIQSEEQA